MASCWRYAGKRFRYCSYGITPRVCAPKKSRYQTVRSPRRTGRFRSNGADRKCSSMAWKPASIARKCSGPIAIMVERPIAESIVRQHWADLAVVREREQCLLRHRVDRVRRRERLHVEDVRRLRILRAGARPQQPLRPGPEVEEPEPAVGGEEQGARDVVEPEA